MIEFVKGPLGFIIKKNGEIVGKIKNFTPRGWGLSITGRNFPVEKGSVADYMGKTQSHLKIVRTLTEAKKLAKTLLMH